MLAQQPQQQVQTCPAEENPYTLGSQRMKFRTYDAQLVLQQTSSLAHVDARDEG